MQWTRSFSRNSIDRNKRLKYTISPVWRRGRTYCILNIYSIVVWWSSKTDSTNFLEMNYLNLTQHADIWTWVPASPWHDLAFWILDDDDLFININWSSIIKINRFENKTLMCHQLDAWSYSNVFIYLYFYTQIFLLTI